jgi:hypothetical protein
MSIIRVEPAHKETDLIKRAAGFGCRMRKEI